MLWICTVAVGCDMWCVFCAEQVCHLTTTEVSTHNLHKTSLSGKKQTPSCASKKKNGVDVVGGSSGKQKQNNVIELHPAETCYLQCEDGYWDKTKGNDAPFTCKAENDKTKRAGISNNRATSQPADKLITCQSA